MQLDELKTMTKPLSVPIYDAVSLEIEYRPAALGCSEAVALTQKMNQSTVHETQVDCMARMFLLVVAWWDLYDGEKPMALNLESIRELPTFVMARVFEAITNNETGGNSAITIKTDQR